MVTALITGPNRIPNLKIGEALGRPGVYALHSPEETQQRIQDYRERQQPVVYYPPALPTDRREGRLFSVAQRMPDLEPEAQAGYLTLVHEVVSDIMPGVQLELIAEEKPMERLAA